MKTREEVLNKIKVIEEDFDNRLREARKLEPLKRLSEMGYCKELWIALGVLYWILDEPEQSDKDSD